MANVPEHKRSDCFDHSSSAGSLVQISLTNPLYTHRKCVQFMQSRPRGFTIAQAICVETLHDDVRVSGYHLHLVPRGTVFVKIPSRNIKDAEQRDYQ
jgi:hypothetical protein